ncbi:MAG: HU family DNA-binding protein [Firmicutes bacterium]|nr:HU family DNA-binding protein [Bacillota bacterium]
MTKADLISAVAENVDLKKKDVERVVNSVFSTIEAALAKGDKVQLVGFGTFVVRRRPARVGRNPQTGEDINIPETTVPVFKPGKSLKDAVS